MKGDDEKNYNAIVYFFYVLFFFLYLSVIRVYSVDLNTIEFLTVHISFSFARFSRLKNEKLIGREKEKIYIYNNRSRNIK